MTNKEIILKSVQFIEANLKEEINVLDMANSVYYSLYHFIRLFQSVTGYSPKTYLQQRRLSEALKELKNTYPLNKSGRKLKPFIFEKF
jgi:AraC family transcriptional regulator